MNRDPLTGTSLPTIPIDSLRVHRIGEDLDPPKPKKTGGRGHNKWTEPNDTQLALLALIATEKTGLNTKQINLRSNGLFTTSVLHSSLHRLRDEGMAARTGGRKFATWHITPIGRKALAKSQES